MEKPETISLDLSPVGVRILQGDEPVPATVPRFEGISYCQAILRATFGRELILDPSSIRVCQWSPVVLGFKAAENDFEKSINRTLPYGRSSIYLAPIAAFKKGPGPDIVIIRAPAETFRAIIGVLGYDAFIPYNDYKLDETALSIFADGPLKGFSRWAIKNVNRWLYWMNGFAWWQKLTTVLFRSTLITRLFDRFITKYMANMSMCRNSTVIPRKTGRANISFFCTGGIAWGKNPYDFMTSGFPYAVYEKIADRLRYPGHADGRVTAASEKLRKKMQRNEPVETWSAP